MHCLKTLQKDINVSSFYRRLTMMRHPNQPTSYKPVDWSRYAWKASPDDPGYYTRHPAGGEHLLDFMNRYKDAHHNILRGIYFTVPKPMSTEEFMRRTRNAWQYLRFDLPTVALRLKFDENNETILTYRSVDSLEYLHDWTERTVKFLPGETDLADLRFRLGQKPVTRENGDQTFIYIIKTSPTSYGALFHSHHIPFDGIGMKLVSSKIASFLASNVNSDELDWGNEAKNLTPGFPSILNENEVLSGPAYEEFLHKAVDDYFTGMARREGLKDREIVNGPTKRHHITLSVEESKKIIKGCKTFGSTVNIVAHAALCIMTHNDNPRNPSMPSDAAYVFYALVNSRERFIAPYNAKDGYTGWGLGMASQQIPVSVVAFSAVAGEVAQLKIVSEAVKGEYTKLKGSVALLSAEVRLTETMIADVTPGVTPKPWTTPSFAGDGIAEIHMDRDYFDEDGNLVISIEDYFSSVNIKDPGPMFRLWSWRDKLTLSADYNTGMISEEEMKRLMDDWLRIIRLCCV